MPQRLEIRLPAEEAARPEALTAHLARVLGVEASRISGYAWERRSLDARGRSPMTQARMQVWVDEPFEAPRLPELAWPDVRSAPEVWIAGAGPAGLFAALRLIRLGYKPLLIERGKAVRERRRDLARLTREGELNPESNYCFGEGGAGTFSDGKLYTRSQKRGDVRGALEMLVRFGAAPDILAEAHPHIGTNKLPGIIEAMREHIRACGGEIRFGSRLDGLEGGSGSLRALRINGQREAASALILATGHSARDVFELLQREGLEIQAKPFALGLRVEHPQALIDRIQYRCEQRPAYLPPAAYSLVAQVQGKGVYSFCMCPGGIICPAATSPDEVVVNGWSPSKRNNPYANSGMVVEVRLEDMAAGLHGALAGVEFQRAVERRASEAGGGQQVAPAQRLSDFVAGRASSSLPPCSYIPGVRAADLSEVLPGFVAARLREGFRHFGRQMRGYLSEEAVVVGVESRTSSPVRIPRDAASLMHPGMGGLFPCGEGAGYAGGILSAALDGEACAEAAVRWLQTSQTAL
jgi:hypothetical protein